jgi:hypothetical protein
MTSVLEQAGLTAEEVAMVEIYIEDICAPGMPYFMETQAYEKLFDHFACEIPYGVAKGRTGEPDVWILDKLESLV